MSEYRFKTTNIKGKAYVEVNQRVKFFRQEDQYKDWTIHTEFPILDDEQCMCKCSILNVEGRVVAVGHAHEVKASSNINRTSYIENCETSAVGRALGLLGIGIDTSIASANEVQDAIRQQENSTTTKATETKKPAAAANKSSVEEDFKKAVAYLERHADAKSAWEKIAVQSKAKFSDEQFKKLEGLVVALSNEKLMK